MRSGSAESRDDDGFTLIELMVSMAILLIVSGIFTVSFTSLQVGIRRSYSEVDAQTAARKAETILDRQVRYASTLNDPVTVNGSQYEEWQSGPAGGDQTCTQWRVVLASGTLQWRQWVLKTTAPSTPVPSAPVWATVVTGIDTSLGNVFTTPTTDNTGVFAALGESLAVPVQRELAVNLTVKSGSPTGRATVADVFTAQNTSTSTTTHDTGLPAVGKALMLRRIRRGIHRRTTGDDSGFALIYAVLIILVITGLATAILGLVVAQVQPTQLARKRQQTLNNAEAGIQSVVGRFRASTGASATTGLLSALPQCAKNAKYSVISGPVDNNGDTYTANVYWLSVNPANFSFSTIQSNALYCSPLNVQPAYAYIVAAGASTADVGVLQVTGDRTLHAIYQFKTSNLQTAGGRIKEYTQNLCWDVGTGNSYNSPAVGTQVVLQPCQAGNYPAQSFTYEPNLTLVWTGNGQTNLCMQSSNNTTGLAVTLQTCYVASPTTGNTYPYTVQPAQELQEWGFNDYGHFATAADNGGLNGNCISTASGNPVAGAGLILGGCTSSVSDFQAYNPDASVGAGAAGGTYSGFPGTNGQMVNFQEFGRCIDLTGQTINAPYDIDYPCKQAPNGNLVAFNQRFVFTPINGSSSLGTLSTNNSLGYYCLTANGFNADGTSKSTNFQPCNGQALATSVGSADLLTTQQWTFTGNIVTDYANSYNVKTVYNGSTYCLSIATAGAGGADSVWSTQILEPCNGSNRQKWDAPAIPYYQLLSGVGEDVDH